MFENVEQLEKEIIEFEQNILASRDLIISLRNINDSIKNQNESISKELQKIIAQFKAIPGEISDDNIAFQNALNEANKALFDANKKELDTYNLGIKKSVDSIHAYESGLEQRYDALLKDTYDSLTKTEENINAKIDKAVYDIHVYEKQVEAKAEELLATMNSQIKQTQSDFLNNTQRFVDLIHSYEDSLESRNQDVINKTIEMLNNCIESTEKSFKEETNKYTNELLSSVTEMKRYEQLLDAKYNELIIQAQQTNDALMNQINKTYKAVNSKSNLLMVMVIISIVVSAIAIIL